MKCPLLEISWQIARPGEKAYKSDCLKEECAWWRESVELCAMPDIAYRLAEIQARLESQERNELWRVKE